MKAPHTGIGVVFYEQLSELRIKLLYIIALIRNREWWTWDIQLLWLGMCFLLYAVGAQFNSSLTSKPVPSHPFSDT